MLFWGIVQAILQGSGIEGPFLVVELEIIIDPSSGFCHTVVGFEIHLFILQGTPHPFDEDIVDPSTLAIHADLDACMFESLPARTVRV
jgi:hypothetical protein